MASLIAIGYDEEMTAHESAEEVYRLADDLAMPRDAVAVIVRDSDGGYQVTTNHRAVGGVASWGMFWNLLFGVLFFVPVLGTAVGAGLGAIMGRISEAGIDEGFEERVRAMVKPGTSCLFLIVESVPPEVVVEGLRHYGGTVVTSRLSNGTEAELREALHGVPAAA